MLSREVGKVIGGTSSLSQDKNAIKTPKKFLSYCVFLENIHDLTKMLARHSLYPQLFGTSAFAPTDFEAFSTTYVHPLILRPRALFYRTDCTRRFKLLTHALPDSPRSPERTVL